MAPSTTAGAARPAQEDGLMTDTAQPTVDVATLRAEVQAKYREVAQDPTGDYHFHTGAAQLKGVITRRG